MMGNFARAWILCLATALHGASIRGTVVENQTITDVHGRYPFGSLAPGGYRVLSSFEYRMPDSKTMTEAQAQPLEIAAHSDIALDLSLYVIR